MKDSLKFILMLIGVSNVTSSALADSTFLFLQAKYEYSANSRQHFGFSAGIHELPNESSLFSLTRKPTMAITLYSTEFNDKKDRLYLNEGSQSLCQRSAATCITLGAIIGAGAIYMLSETNRDIDNGNIEITFNTKSE